MANGIKRKRLLGIAKETTFGTAPASPTYVLPVIEWEPGERVQHVENDAQAGSIYRINDVNKMRQWSEPSFTIKVDEASLPLLLLSFGTMVSALAPSETVVYNHTITFTNSNQKVSYTLYLDDPDRSDIVLTGFRIGSININFDREGYITAEITGISKYPVSQAVTATLANDWKEFIGNHSEFKIADDVGVLTTVPLLTASLSHNFSLSGAEDNFYLGETDLSQSFNKESEFTAEVSLHFPDLTYKNKWSATTKQQFSANIKDSGRIVTGSTTSLNPSILFTYPRAYFSEWAEDGAAGDILKQNLTIKVLDTIGVTDTPVRINITNGVASY